jgi:hypothetical protein
MAPANAPPAWTKRRRRPRSSKNTGRSRPVAVHTTPTAAPEAGQAFEGSRALRVRRDRRPLPMWRLPRSIVAARLPAGLARWPRSPRSADPSSRAQWSCLECLMRGSGPPSGCSSRRVDERAMHTRRGGHTSARSTSHNRPAASGLHRHGVSIRSRDSCLTPHLSDSHDEDPSVRAGLTLALASCAMRQRHGRCRSARGRRRSMQGGLGSDLRPAPAVAASSAAYDVAVDAAYNPGEWGPSRSG